MNIKGIGASRGYALAKVYKLSEINIDVTQDKITDVEAEVAKLETALNTSVKELEQIRENARVNLSEEEAEVFSAHILMVQDPEILTQTKAKIETENLNAAGAFKEVTDMMVMIFESMVDNEYMQERAADVKDVRKRVIAHLKGEKIADLTSINEEVVIVAEDLTPSETSQLNKQFVKGFVTNIGGRTSHSAIMARSLEIPAVVGTSTITNDVNDGDFVIVDGITGDVIINPSNDVISIYEEKLNEFNEQKAALAKLVNEESISLDGTKVKLAGNIGTPNDVSGVIENGGDAVGLYRTEFLYMDNTDFPTEEEQYNAYKKVLIDLGKQVVVRTLDIGGDKKLDYWKLPEEENPFLGYRAIRLCLDQVDVFRVQLRALLRASVHGDLAIMFPMIATVQEFRDAKAIFEEEKAKLISQNIAVSENIELGIMIEVPSAAVIAKQFAKEVDFFSIGTNDLIGYTFAADRMNEKVSYLYQPFNPSILNLVANVIQASHNEGKWTGMCGEMAGEALAIPLLFGLGLDEFSMSATSVLNARSIIRSLDKEQCQKIAQQALELSTEEEVLELMKSNFPQLV